AGWLAFITPTSMISRGSTWPVKAPGVGSDCGSGTRPIAPLKVYAEMDRSPWSTGAPMNIGSIAWLVLSWLNSLCTSVPGRPLAIFVRPDNGPKPNRYVCTPSPMVTKPSPPEICWHLMRPPTGFAAGLAGSLGCKFVAVGHCTLKLCAPTGNAHKARSAAAIPRPIERVLTIKPPSGTFRACGAQQTWRGEISRVVREACVRRGHLAHGVVVKHLVLELRP